jgi:predicted esterase
VVCALAAVVVFGSQSSADESASKTVANALIKLQGHLDIANKAMGEDGAQLLGQRLADDLENFDDPTMPEGFTKAAWTERLTNVATLDTSIVTQVLSNKLEPLSTAKGLAERIIVSRVDGTLQPIALYVPATLRPNPSLVVLLHGRPQTETEILGAPYFRSLADEANAIIVAPWGRGNYNFFGAATDDVYQTVDEVAAAFNIDSHRVFLAGYSMGGFSVFKVGPTHGSRWSAVLCISGSILNSEAASVVKAWRGTKIYVVNGKLDTEIPPQYGAYTAQYLASMGIPTGLYQEPKGTHYIPTLMPALTEAWNDMLKGVVRNMPMMTQTSFTLPQMDTDSPSLKP